MSKLKIGELHIFLNKEKMKYTVGRLTAINNGTIDEEAQHVSFHSDGVEVYECGHVAYYKHCVPLPDDIYDRINEIAYLNLIK